MASSEEIGWVPFVVTVPGQIHTVAMGNVTFLVAIVVVDAVEDDATSADAAGFKRLIPTKLD